MVDNWMFYAVNYSLLWFFGYS